MRPSPPTAAFTLLELLIAVSIFAIVLAAITTVFYSAMRLRNKTAARFDEFLPIQHAITIIQRDLTGLVAPGGTFSGDFKTAALSGGQGEQNATVFCTATAPVDDTSPFSELQKISYYLDGNAGPTGGRDLIRAVTRNLLPPTTTDSDKQWLLGNVRTLTFTYYNGSTWADTWDSTTQTNLPRAIKVQLDLAAPDATRPVPPTIELVVPLLVTARTNQTANAGGQP